MKNKIYRLAQIGRGNWGKILSSAIDNDPKFSLEWIHTRNPIDDTRYVSSLESIISKNPDGIVLATPLIGREKWIMELLQRKIPLLVEKPLAYNLKMSNDIFDYSENLSVPIIVNYVHSYSQTIDWLTSSGLKELGEILIVRILIGQPGGRYFEEGVDTLLLSHVLAIVYKLFPNLSCNWKKYLSTSDNNGKLVYFEIISENNNQSDKENSTNFPKIQLITDLSYPFKSRIIEIRGLLGTLIAEFGGNGEITVATWETNSNNSTVTKINFDQSNNLRFILEDFYSSISAFQNGKINLDTYHNYSNTKLALKIDSILEKLK